MNNAITPRLELVTCVLFAAALLLTLQLDLLPSLLAGLLVYALGTCWCRCCACRCSAMREHDWSRSR